MGWLVRKISRAKWEPKTDLEPTFIAADAVTIDLRTSNNRLSFWECGHDEEGIEVSKVAVALAGGLERPDRIDIAWVEKQLVESIGIKFEKTEGDTPVTDLKGLHLDAISLDLSRMEKLARILAEVIRNDGNHRRLTKEDILELLSQAVQEGRLCLNDFKDEQAKLREALKSRLES